MKSGRQAELPVKQKQKALPHYTIVVGIVFKNDKILIDKRKQNALLGGLWEFPGGKKKKSESFKPARLPVRVRIGEEPTPRLRCG
ncbi:MAG: NUDIX domain-containing protein [Planctomycetota bacterium]|jgi:A/G-specific adenine glycosylase